MLDQLLATGPTKQSQFLELGTEWIHAYSLYPALFTDAEIWTYDVQESRSLHSIKLVIPTLRKQIDDVLGVDPAAINAARSKIDQIENCQKLEEIYQVLRIKHTIDLEGQIQFADDQFDAIYAMDVLEHVPARAFAALCREWFRIAKPGAPMVTEVGLDDHLTHYDKHRSQKEYLRYSRAFATCALDSRLLYINRMTATQIISAMINAGFAVEQADRELIALDFPVHGDYADQADIDLRTVRLRLRLRKPAPNAS